LNFAGSWRRPPKETGRASDGRVRTPRRARTRLPGGGSGRIRTPPRCAALSQRHHPGSPWFRTLWLSLVLFAGSDVVATACSWSACSCRMPSRMPSETPEMMDVDECSRATWLEQVKVPGQAGLTGIAPASCPPAAERSRHLSWLHLSWLHLSWLHLSWLPSRSRAVLFASGPGVVLAQSSSYEPRTLIKQWPLGSKREGAKLGGLDWHCSCIMPSSSGAASAFLRAEEADGWPPTIGSRGGLPAQGVAVRFWGVRSSEVRSWGVRSSRDPPLRDGVRSSGNAVVASRPKTGATFRDARPLDSVSYPRRAAAVPPRLAASRTERRRNSP